MEDNSLIFLFDPYSAWSFANCATVKAVASNYSDRLRVWLMPGGLYAGISATQQTHELADMQSAEASVAEDLSGAEFGNAFYNFIERSGGVIDSEIPSDAILSVQQLAPELAVEYACNVLAARYVDGLDIGDRKLLKSLAEKLGVNGDEFENTFNSPIAIAFAEEIVYNDKANTEEMPLYYFKTGKHSILLASRFIEYSNLTRKLERFLDTEEE